MLFTQSYSWGHANKDSKVFSAFFPWERCNWRLPRIQLALIQLPAPSNPATLSHCLTWIRLDKPSPIPTGPIETLNVSLKRFLVWKLYFFRQNSAEESQEKGASSNGRKRMAAALKIPSQGPTERGCWSCQEFNYSIDWKWRDNCRDN